MRKARIATFACLINERERAMMVNVPRRLWIDRVERGEVDAEGRIREKRGRRVQWCFHAAIRLPRDCGAHARQTDDVGCWMFHLLGILSIVLHKHSQKIVQTGGAMALVFFSSACITFIPAYTVMAYSTTIRPSQASAHPPDYKPA